MLYVRRPNHFFLYIMSSVVPNFNAMQKELESIKALLRRNHSLEIDVRKCAALATLTLMKHLHEGFQKDLHGAKAEVAFPLLFYLIALGLAIARAFD